MFNFKEKEQTVKKFGKPAFNTKYHWSDMFEDQL